MQVALIANTAWLDEELAMFRYLVVGLIDEQVRVVQVVPQGLAVEETSAFGERIVWQDSPWALLRRWRLTRLKDQLDDLEVDLLHALDGRLWDASLRMAARLQLPIVLGATSRLDLAAVERLGRAAVNPRVAFAATTEPLGQALRQRLGSEALVQVIPPGVHLPTLDEQRHAESETLCTVVTGTGELDEDYDALLHAMQSVVRDHPDVQFFFDSQGADQHSIWQAAGRLGLLANISFVPRRLGHRELLLNADALIQPQALGRSRSLALQAMASAMPVLARTDPWVDYLVEGSSAWLVDSPDPDRWNALIRSLIDKPDAGRTLGLRARQWVDDNYRAAQVVTRTLALYRRITGEPIKLAAVP